MIHPDASIDTVYHESIILEMVEHDWESAPKFDTLLNLNSWSGV
jgi:hypothetical protein